VPYEVAFRVSAVLSATRKSVFCAIVALVRPGTVVENSSRMLKPPAKRSSPAVIFRSVKDLALHPATSLVPTAPLLPATNSAAVVPMEVLADGRILFGREQYERARTSPRRRVPTVVVIVPEDQIEMYVLGKALDSQYLTDDQRACLAVEFAKRLSARMRKDRATKAAAVRYGRTASRTTGTDKQDARAQACQRFRVAPKKFRQIRKLVVAHPKLYKQVLDGTITLKQARDRAAENQVLQDENERSAAAPPASPAGLIHGDARIVIPALPDDHYTALITDPPYGVNFRQEWRGGAEILIAGDADCHQAIELLRDVMVAAGPKMRRQAFLLTFVPAKYEPEFRSVITELGWTIIAYPIWVKNTRMLYPHLNVASQHERMILATVPDHLITLPRWGGDVLDPENCGGAWEQRHWGCSYGPVAGGPGVAPAEGKLLADVLLYYFDTMNAVAVKAFRAISARWPTLQFELFWQAEWETYDPTHLLIFVAGELIEDRVTTIDMYRFRPHLSGTPEATMNADYTTWTEFRHDVAADWLPEWSEVRAEVERS
jgi:hypothetical protein